MGWVIAQRQPGYFGKRRDEAHRRYDEQYGQGRWRIGFELGELTIGLAEMLQVYEDSYFLFMLGQPDVVDRLAGEASDVYDDDIRNIESGCDYSVQQTPRNHYQDIAIRRVVRRLGRVFRGASPIQIRDFRGDHPLSLTLSPGRIQFHLPQIVRKPLLGWWQPGSVEEAYQSLKLIQTWED